MPMRRRSATSASSSSVATSVPSTSTRPLLGRSSALMVRSSVDLPAPLRPMMPNTSARATSKLSACSACTGSPALLPAPLPVPG